jgi:hypothetical protein
LTPGHLGVKDLFILRVNLDSGFLNLIDFDEKYG